MSNPGNFSSGQLVKDSNPLCIVSPACDSTRLTPNTKVRNNEASMNPLPNWSCMHIIVRKHQEKMDVLRHPLSIIFVSMSCLSLAAQKQTIGLYHSQVHRCRA